MNIVSSMFTKQHNVDRRIVAGLILFISGGFVLAAQAFHLQWLSFLAPLSVGLVLLGTSVFSRRLGYMISGAIVSGLGVGIYLAAISLLGGEPWVRIGTGMLGLAGGFLVVTILGYWSRQRLYWWALLAAAPIAASGFVLALTTASLLDFVLYEATGIGMTLLVIGLYKKWIGFIIPGCLLVGIGPGVSFAWSFFAKQNALAQTGVMLVWFALGWGLITLFSRIAIEKFVWWPLIPASILGIVGWGLYIGGNPGNAVSFIGNTGSIAMIILGLYLLLMRRGIRH